MFSMFFGQAFVRSLQCPAGTTGASLVPQLNVCSRMEHHLAVHQPLHLSFPTTRVQRTV